MYVNLKAFETDDVEETKYVISLCILIISEPKEELRDGTQKRKQEHHEQIINQSQPADGSESAVEKIDDEEITETTEDPIPRHETFHDEERV